MKSQIQKALASLGMGLQGVNYATYNYKGGVSGGVAAGHASQPGVLSVVDIQFDMAAVAAARSAAGQAAIAAADVLEVVTVQAGTWVPAAFVQVVKAEGAAATADVGDGADPDGFIAAANLNSVGWANSLVTTAFSVAVGGGKLYTADDTIDLTINSNSIDVAQFRLIVVAVDLRTYRKSTF